MSKGIYVLPGGTLTALFSGSLEGISNSLGLC